MNTIRLWRLLIWLGFSTFMVVVVSNLSMLLGRRWNRRSSHWMARWWARGILRATGSRTNCEGLPETDLNGPFVVVSNHRSHMDTPLLIHYLPFLFGFIVKRELMRIPVFAGAMKSIGCVAVNRRKSKDDYAVLDSVAEAVQGGKNILVFPEGTRSPNDDFLPFKKGAVVIAIKAQGPILPVAVSGTNRVIPARKFRVFAGPILLRIGEPIPTEGLTMDDRDELLRRVQASVTALYEPGYPN